MEIRTLGLEHFEQIKEIQEAYITEVTPEDEKEFTDSLTAGNMVGCFDGDKLVGYSGADYYPEYKGYNTSMTAVIREYWHKGIGTQLLKTVLERIPSNERLYYEAWTLSPPNKPNAHRLLEKLDFKLERITTNEMYAKMRNCNECCYRNKANCTCEIQVYYRNGLKEPT